MSMDFSLTNVSHIECVYSGSCNLTCTYCCVHKNPAHMHNYNKLVREAIQDQTFQNNIIKRFQESKESVDSISLWGGEPTINADLGPIFLQPILDHFKNIDTIMFSTNGTIPFDLGIKIFIDFLTEYATTNNRKIYLDIQFSIDGPAYMTDVSRNRINVTDTICNLLNETVYYANSKCNEYFTLRMTTKPTVDASYWPFLLQDNNLLEWFQFFNNLQVKAKSIKNNDNIEIYLTQEPTLVSPGDFTKQDGINYAKLIRKMRELDISLIPEYGEHPLTRRYLHGWIDTLGDQLYNPYSLTCGAGIGSSAVDYEGTLMTCHRFYDNYKMSGDYSPAGIKSSVALTRDEDVRLNYVNAVNHSSYHFKQSVIDSYLIALVHSGEIDKKYLDQRYRNLLFTFMGGIACPVGECGSVTSSLYLPPIANIRLLCNGALEELVYYYDTTL